MKEFNLTRGKSACISFDEIPSSAKATIASRTNGHCLRLHHNVIIRTQEAKSETTNKNKCKNVVIALQNIPLNLQE